MCIARRCTPARSRAAARAIVRRSRTRSFASAIATDTRSSSSRKGSTTPRSTLTASRPRCRKKYSWLFSRPFPVLSGCGWYGRAMPSNTTMSTRANSIRPCRPGVCRACSWPGRSMAPPGMKRRRRRDTSRAEYRLTLRADNADQRLTDKGMALGCVGQGRSIRHGAKMAALDAAKALAKSLTLTPNEAARYGLALNRDGVRRSAFELLAYPEIGWEELRGVWPELSVIDPGIAIHLEIDAKYDVYLKRQIADVDAFRRDEGLILTNVDYADVPGLSNEARSKLEAARPRTVGQAGRLDGLTPAALGILAAYLRREARRKTAAATA